MPFRVTKSIDVDFAHHVHGHSGACINIHGHTWKFQITVESDKLDREGFVVDFKWLKNNILLPIHNLLDHRLAIYVKTYEKVKHDLAKVGNVFLNTRNETGTSETVFALGIVQESASQLPWCFIGTLGGMGVVAFEFPPTSERLAEWFWNYAKLQLSLICQEKGLSEKAIRVTNVRVYETQHPVESYAEYND